jgi:catechol 2,3-dioxygenase-like lactoylglutathione lyase family enzyme
MIDHFTLTVRNLQRSKKFYNAALAPLGYRVLMDFGEYVGYGDRKPYLWLKQGAQATRPMHIAFMAKDRAAVNAFHKAALAAGARDDGKPGVREMYHPNYYGAFVVELDGHPIEAVCHAPPASASAKKSAPSKSARKARAKAKAPARKKRR